MPVMTTLSLSGRCARTRHLSAYKACAVISQLQFCGQIRGCGLADAEMAFVERTKQVHKAMHWSDV